ncbi:type VII secretion protein EccB [Amycolatopsis sp. WAC 04197]|uniref:type VII secretion protein EccB n=1 Tax=Amycolatopsis sp. WAC 04197 TaxID=2203199 RepID=UPI000F7A3210|nr:type VII secretion protein EccB [Amycolatopsis sp. WAC 04197]RSN39931.1 type VII secretion protein EccB [Amycolatopsis sp. WAC 04197]
MKSRKDQVQAYFFVVGRLTAAVAHGDADAIQAPGRRMITGTIFGIMIAVLLAAIFGIYGLFVPGTDNSWRQAGTIVLDEDSGARYLYVDGQLRPVLNYSSARLLAPKADGKMVAVSPDSLKGTPVGQPVGISGAPDALPTSAELDTGAWTVCVSPESDGGDSKVVTVLIGRPAGGALTDRQAFLVSGPNGTVYLVWNGSRLRIPDVTALASLGYGNAKPAPVSAAWLNPIPQGPDLGVPPVPGLGGPGPIIAGRQSLVGQIYEVRNAALGTDQLYLIREDGAAAVNRTVAALVLAAPSTAQTYPDGPVEPIRVGVAEMAGVPTSGAVLGTGLPASPPELVGDSPETQRCMRYGTGSADPPVPESLPSDSVRAASVPSATHEAGTAAGRVGVPAGRGVLITPKAVPGAPPGPPFLVTPSGMRYPLAGADELTALGYQNVAPVSVPQELLDLFPAGPLLSTAAASATAAS